MQALRVVQNAVVVWVVSLLAVHAQTDTALTDRLIYMDGVATCFYETNTVAGAEACIGQGAERCMDTDPVQNQTTTGMMFCARAEGQVWDQLLNSEYQKAISSLREIDLREAELFPEFANRESALRTAQRAWIALRDADCQLEYAMWGSGSIRQIAGSYCIMERTAERTIYLRFLGDQLR